VCLEPSLELDLEHALEASRRLYQSLEARLQQPVKQILEQYLEQGRLHKQSLKQCLDRPVCLEPFLELDLGHALEVHQQPSQSLEHTQQPIQSLKQTRLQRLVRPVCLQQLHKQFLGLDRHPILDRLHKQPHPLEHKQGLKQVLDLSLELKRLLSLDLKQCLELFLEQCPLHKQSACLEVLLRFRPLLQPYHKHGHPLELYQALKQTLLLEHTRLHRVYLELFLQQPRNLHLPQFLQLLLRRLLVALHKPLKHLHQLRHLALERARSLLPQLAQ
jgi:hypothetical protein